MFFRSRGIGSEYGLTCLVTGEQKGLMDNISAFVVSRLEGERAVRMLKGRPFLDYRPHEPDWIQVKVGVIHEHRLVLTRLHEGTTALNGILTPQLLKWALLPDQFPGYEPFVLRRLKETQARLDEALTALRPCPAVGPATPTGDGHAYQADHNWYTVEGGVACLACKVSMPPGVTP